MKNKRCYDEEDVIKIKLMVLEKGLFYESIDRNINFNGNMNNQNNQNNMNNVMNNMI